MSGVRMLVLPSHPGVGEAPRGGLPPCRLSSATKAGCGATHPGCQLPLLQHFHFAEEVSQVGS